MAPRHAAQNVDTVVASLNRLATKRTREDWPAMEFRQTRPSA